MSDAAITGIYVALPTPFDERRQIDAKALLHLVDYLLPRSFSGFALCTEAAEDPLLTAEERRALVKLVGERVKDKKRLIVSVSAPSSAEALDLVRQAELFGAEGLLVSLHRVPGIGYRELFRHVERIVRSTKVPVLLNARPGNVLESLTPEELGALVSHVKFGGVFAPHQPASAIEPWVKRFAGKAGATVLGASSLGHRAAKERGATGALCGLALVASDKAEAMWKLVADGKSDAAERLEAELRPVVELMGPPVVSDPDDGIQRLARKLAKRPLSGAALLPTYPFALLKETLRLQGHPIRADVRSPFEPVRGDAAAKLKAALQVAGLL